MHAPTAIARDTRAPAPYDNRSPELNRSIELRPLDAAQIEDSRQTSEAIRTTKLRAMVRRIFIGVSDRSLPPVEGQGAASWRCRGNNTRERGSRPIEFLRGRGRCGDRV